MYMPPKPAPITTASKSVAIASSNEPQSDAFLVRQGRWPRSLPVATSCRGTTEMADTDYPASWYAPREILAPIGRVSGKVEADVAAAAAALPACTRRAAGDARLQGRAGRASAHRLGRLPVANGGFVSPGSPRGRAR